MRLAQNSGCIPGEVLNKEPGIDRTRTHQRIPALQGVVNEEVTGVQDRSISLPDVVSYGLAKSVEYAYLVSIFSMWLVVAIALIFLLLQSPK